MPPGVDIGATEIYVAVSPERDARPIRSFETFTEELMALADWLQQCGVRTVAMESTGVYWIPLMQILEARGLEVYLVNARSQRTFPAAERMYAIVNGCSTCIPSACSVRRFGPPPRCVLFVRCCATDRLW